MIFEKVAKLLAEQFGLEADEITEETSFEDLGADSVDIVELSMALEEASGVTIEDDDLPNMKTVGDLMSYIESHKA